ncbi:MAG: helix-turn-helix transcriptional regulator [Deltaproteobacteria bacterium]|nr:helix-turn-helix transcriptional regulator [Deltaproteobacteria bacterium]
MAFSGRSGDKSAVRSVSMLDRYRGYYLGRDLFVETNPPVTSPWERLRLELPVAKGNGWLEMLQISHGLTVGLCDYHLNDYHEDDLLDVDFGLGFEILLSGAFDISVPGGGRTAVRGGELWLRHGRVGPLRYRQHPESVMRGLSIELPLTMVESWLDSAPDQLARGLEALMGYSSPVNGNPLPGARLLAAFARDSPELAAAAARLLATGRDSICGQLQFESLVLDLLARLLSQGYAPDRVAPRGRLRHQAAIDEAVDILRRQWSDPPSIAALARRVGTNECYLKSEFRQALGLSIGEFVRKLRMERALELIEAGGQSVLETAYSVGYSNPSHFSAAFKRYHGRLPSCYLSRI